ncbi:putative leucine-rich repeat-containing protein DDB_G0290503 isoform X1 [Toxotes jaculatrix]|uniref:putative leucine-rich repeat-containing protein DDB_G0290503 isoform X1 n=1 Tax=Toxotes jaculatrix TaxID=941984 RepID=UPI001B3B0986|nr:putative leucine-rich repeat-containing protein DDB_G0290503 isoform X1 [Toxotes jaculatrix]
MAACSHFIWIPLLLSCIFPASDNRHVSLQGSTLISRTGHSEVDDILSKIPITLPEGIDPKNVNITSISIKTCTDAKGQLILLSRQLQEATLHNSQLDVEAFGLRREIRLLKLQLATCSSTASAITSSYQTQLQSRMKQLLDTFDSDTFQILKIISLTREVEMLQKKLKIAANSSETTLETRVLKSELQKKMIELNDKKQQIEESHTNSTLILQIISLQNQIWDLEQEESRRGETSTQLRKRILALQEQLNRKISELRGKGDATSAMLQLISVHSKIAALQRLISVHIDKSRDSATDYQRQFKQKTELLKKKILQLNRDESNTELTKEILTLQAEVENLRQLMLNAKKTRDSQIGELRVALEEEKKQQENLQKQLEEIDYSQSQLIIKIIDIMKEVRELEDDEQQQTTSTSQATTLQALLQAKEREFAKAQADIKELQRKLQLKSEECSGLEERYAYVKNELEQKIAELNRTGDSKAALVLNVINLHDELQTLRDLISATKDPDSISELRRQLKEKEAELNSKTADIERLIPNPKIILTIIELQDEIWDLQKKAINGTTSNRVKELQDRVDGLISEIDDPNTNLMLKILALQSQVEQLQRQLSGVQVLQGAHVAQLRNDLAAKRRELQEYVNEVNEKNQINARLILTVTDLHNQLRNLEKEWRNDNTTFSLTITELREQLRAKKVENSRDKAEIQTLRNLLQAKEREQAIAQAQALELQRKLQLKSEECSGLEERYAYVKNELDQKIVELNRTGDAKAALVLNVINLHNELQTLKDLIVTTEDPERVLELQRQLREKQQELSSKTADIQRMIPSPKMILTIIELQSEIWDLQKKAANETTNNRIKELQTRVDGLITEINDKGNDNTKLILKIMTLQSQVEQLQRQLSDLQVMKYTQLTQLKNDLNTKKNELQKYVNELNEKNEANARLILTITDLNNQLRNLQEEKQNDGQTASATITNLREQLTVKVEEHLRDQDQIKALEDKLNQTEAQCSDREQKIKDLQNDLDEKMKELETQSDGVTSLALQVSTLTLQLEELKRQLQNTDSKAKIKELQKQIEEKNNELAKKTEELKATSTQPQRLLQIISIQTEIEKYVNVAANDSDYAKIRALQDHLNYLIDGIKDEDNENTKLVFKVLSYQDEIAKLKKQEESQTKTLLEKIKELENELEDIRNQITEKTLELDSSDTRITNLSAQIMELHQKIKPLEDEISYLKETNTDNLSELQNRLSLTEKQLQDSELRLKDSDAKNFNLIMEIADLRTQLKKAQRQTSKAAEKNINELEQQLQTQQRENRKLEHANRDLKQEVKELKTCCSEDSIHCEGLQRQLQQSQEDADRLQQQLQDRDTYIEQLQQELKNQTDLERQLQETQDNADNLQQQLDKKDDIFTDLQQELEALAAEKNKLLDDYNDLLNERNKLEDTVQDLQNKLQDVDEKTIYTSKTTLDPNTAHPRIVLSADNTEMSTSEELQNVSDNPGRFDVVLAVLGKTGFSAGRHYWEVSVAGKLCYHLGMASESAPRKGTVTFNPRNGFWTIVLNKQGQYRAIDRIPASIPVETQPLTLGILLDYKKGQISFYDAGARSHLYSFTSQKFTDKIYPFINFCVEDVENQTPIVILTAGSTDWIK